MKNLIVKQAAALTRAVLNQTQVKNAISDIVTQCVRSELKNIENQKRLWRAANVRPYDLEHHWCSIPNSITEERMMMATREAVEFIHKNIPNLEGKFDAFETLDFALEAVTVENGLHTEFGVFSGTTINHIARRIGQDRHIHGFDSFEGLPENWGPAAVGTFDKGGEMPEVDKNVTLHKGWFDDTIDVFLENNPGPMAFIHADADLYSSTKTILSKLRQRIVPGTIIVFDEFINYPSWKDHEYKAFMEFVDSNSVGYEYIAYTDRGYSVAVRITQIGN